MHIIHKIILICVDIRSKIKSNERVFLNIEINMDESAKITTNKSVDINAGGATLGRVVKQIFGGKIGGAIDNFAEPEVGVPTTLGVL